MDVLLRWLGRDPDSTQQPAKLIESVLATSGDTSSSLRVDLYGDSQMCSDWRLAESVQFFCDAVLSRALPDGFHFHLSAYVVPLISAPKQFPPDSPRLTRLDINSGMCMPAAATLYVFREAEARKVFLHELMHACRIMQEDGDFPIDLQTSAVWRDLQQSHAWLARFQQQVLLHEATTEALACALELTFRSGRDGALLRDLREQDQAHSRSVRDMFLEWGDHWHGSQARSEAHASSTHAIEYYVLKDMAYAWALQHRLTAPTA